MAEKSRALSPEEIAELLHDAMIPENEGIRPLHRVLFQQFLRPFRALRARVRS